MMLGYQRVELAKMTEMIESNEESNFNPTSEEPKNTSSWRVTFEEWRVNIITAFRIIIIVFTIGITLMMYLLWPELISFYGLVFAKEYNRVVRYYNDWGKSPLQKCYGRLERELEMEDSWYQSDLAWISRWKTFNFFEEWSMEEKEKNTGEYSRCYEDDKNNVNFFYKKYREDSYVDHWGGKLTPLSGPGSTLDSTIYTRCQLLKIIEEFQIDHIIDISCGDFFWMESFLFDDVIDLGKIRYTGSDIVEPLVRLHQSEYEDEKSIEFIHGGDITKDGFWDRVKEGSSFYNETKTKMVLVRHTFQHNYMTDVKNALRLINEDSGAQYLFLSNRICVKKNSDAKKVEKGGGVRLFPYNYFLEPFSLPLVSAEASSTRLMKWKV